MATSDEVGAYMKRGRPSDQVVGQVSRYLGWVGSRLGRKGERAVGAIVAQDIDDKLVMATKANTQLSLWRLDHDFKLDCVVGCQHAVGVEQ